MIINSTKNQFGEALLATLLYITIVGVVSMVTGDAIIRKMHEDSKPAHITKTCVNDKCFDTDNSDKRNI